MAWCPAGRVLAKPSQAPQILEPYGITRAQADAAVWVVDLTTGEKWHAAAAVNRLLIECGGLGQAAAMLYRNRFVRWVEDVAYRWVAAHRHWLAKVYSMSPACNEIPSPCV